MTTESPKLVARLAGIFFLLTIIGGIIAQMFISERLVNFADASATANNILANKGRFRSASPSICWRWHARWSPGCSSTAS